MAKQTRLTAADKERIVLDYRSGVSQQDLCKKYGCHRDNIRRWNNSYDGTLESLENGSSVPLTPHPDAHTKEEKTWIEDAIAKNNNCGIDRLHEILKNQYGYTRTATGLYRFVEKCGLLDQALTKEYKYSKFSTDAEKELDDLNNQVINAVGAPNAMLGMGRYGIIFSDRLYLIGIADKTCFLIKEVRNCIKEKNSTVFCILLRVLIDNCNRAYALNLVPDPIRFTFEINEGRPLNQFKDKDNQTLSDGYLIKHLAKLDDTIKDVYEITCGDIHFSYRGVWRSIDATNDNIWRLQIGKPREEDFPEIFACYEHFIRYTKLLIKLITEQGKFSQQRFIDSLTHMGDDDDTK